jgi:uncharacterized protein affecting Mg2+/Co2+ transport
MSSQWGAATEGLDGAVVAGRGKSRALLICTLLLVSSVALLLEARPAHAQIPTISVAVDATPDSRPEPGGSFTYSVTINNSGSDAVVLTALSEDGSSLNNRGTCDTGVTINAGSSYSCSFSEDFTGDSGDTKTTTVSATVADDDTPSQTDTETGSVTVSIDDGTDGAEITVDVTADPTSRPQPGGSFTYTVRVQNVGSDAVTLTALSEDGSSLNDRGTCDVGVTIAVGLRYTCSFSDDVTGNDGNPKTTTVTATAADDDTPSDTDTASGTVTVTIGTGSTTGFTVTKTASPTSRPVPGGTFTFSIVVSNSTGSSVTLSTLSDSVYGNLDGRGTCDVPQTISSGSSYSCQFSVEFTGSVGRSETNTVTASGTRSGGGSVSDTDTETITISGTGTLPPIGFNPFNPFNPFLGGLNPFGGIGSTDAGRGPIVVTNNNSSSSSSSAAASVAGGAVGAPPPGTPTTQPPTLVRTGIEALPMAAAGMAILLLGFVMLTAGNRQVALGRKS